MSEARILFLYQTQSSCTGADRARPRVQNITFRVITIRVSFRQHVEESVKRSAMVSKANPGGWVAAALSTRDCSHFIPTSRGGERCCCGRLAEDHPLLPLPLPDRADWPQPSWNPTKHTKAFPTDAYGRIDFQGGAHPHKV